jgi:Flp pilus assembly protein TadB
MSEIVAIGAGAAVVVIVALLGAVARRGPAVRVPPGGGAGRAPSGSIDGSRRASAVAGPVLAGVAGWVVGGPIGLAGAGGAALVLRRRRRARRAAASRRRIEAALPDAVELLVVCVHAGRSPTQAVAELSERGPPAARPGFQAVVRRLHRGDGLADALAQLPLVLGPSAHELAAVVATAEREGLPMAPMLDRLAADARAARRRQGEAATRRLPVQLAFPLVTCVLPSFVLVALAPAVLGALSTLRATAP